MIKYQPQVSKMHQWQKKASDISSTVKFLYKDFMPIQFGDNGTLETANSQVTHFSDVLYFCLWKVSTETGFTCQQHPFNLYHMGFNHHLPGWQPDLSQGF